MDILTNTISLFFRPRQKKIAMFAQEADQIQRKQLQSLLSIAQHTEWGKILANHVFDTGVNI